MTNDLRLPSRWALVGAGRLGTALAPALRDAGVAVAGPLRRGEPLPADADAVLLCVPDRAIADAAATVPAGLLVGHASGLHGLGLLGAREAFGLHPLVAASGPGTAFAGASAAVAGTTARAHGAAVCLARALGMTALTVADEDRPAYHAAASLAANALVVLEDAAERLAATAGVDRAALAPLARGALERWAAAGGPGALTGPVARGDEATVAAQRAALAERAPDALALFDAYAAAGREVAAR